VSREEPLTASAKQVIPGDAPDYSPDDVHLQINLRLHLDKVAEIEAARLRLEVRPPPCRGEMRRLAREIYEARRVRAKVFGQQIFGEPAWDMLLALYFMPSQGEILSVSGLSHAACIPESTGLRWQATLTKEDMIERGPPGIDKRKQFMRLTHKGRALMDTYLTRLYFCDKSVPPFNAQNG
jgi:DNA-binding MarR family transcriptional regulator